MKIVAGINQRMEIKQEIEGAISEFILGIEHVGSTSVEGMSATPCIDMDVVIKDYSMLDAVVRRLEAIGYIHEGNLGIRDREAKITRLSFFKAKKWEDIRMLIHDKCIHQGTGIFLCQCLINNCDSLSQFCISHIITEIKHILMLQYSWSSPIIFLFLFTSKDNSFSNGHPE